MNAQQITLNGRVARCYTGGDPSQPALVLLHGGMGDAWLYWSAVFDSLAETRYVIAPDMPAYGGSDPLPAQHLHALLEWLRDLLDEVGAHERVLIGNAFGALIARLFVAGYPQDIKGLVMVNGGSLPNVPPFMRTIARLPGVGGLPFFLLARSTTAQANRMIHTREVLDADFLATLQAHTGHFARLMRLLAVDPLPQARTPGVPTLLLWGEQDGASGLDEAQRIQKAIPRASLVSIADCGQMPARETPDVFVTQIDLFLRNLDRPTPRKLPGVGKLS